MVIRRGHFPLLRTAGYPPDGSGAGGAPQASGGAHLKAAEGYPPRPAFSAVRQRLKQRKAQELGLAA